MAIVHKATMSPTKAELISAWLPNQKWYDGPVPPAPKPVGAFRFDDPAGEVGIEFVFIQTSADRIWLAPMTYRASALPGADDYLIGTTDHSALGLRYVYDAVGDPLFDEVVRSKIAGREREADITRDLGDGTTEPVAATATARGTGGGGARVEIVRQPLAATAADEADGSAVLLGTLADGPTYAIATLHN